ncbi:MAG TPA: ribose-phosphate diphosphokinase [Zeimonas sp.]|nr:ribose-phosphate diphosphokinase [Zeimonas sp.]
MLFCLEAGESALARELSAALGVPISPHEERRFVDGECKLRPLVEVAGADCCVLLGLHGGPVDSPHDKLWRLLAFVATLRDHGAASVTALVPYLAYARKDRRTKPYDPIGLRYVAQLFEAVGTDRLVVLEAHNVAALQNAFRVPTLHLDAYPAFDGLALERGAQGPLAVASPDPGGVKRAQLWCEALQARLGVAVGFAMVDKRRSAGVVTSAGLVAGHVAGATVLLFDDLVASGETMRRAARALREAGAASVIACAAHGLFIEPAAEVLRDDAIEAVWVSDSVPPFRVAQDDPLRAKMRIVSCAPLFARALR